MKALVASLFALGLVTATAADAPAVASVGVSSKDPVWGSRSAPVTLVLFSDFQCPFCSRVEASIQQLKEKSEGRATVTDGRAGPRLHQPDGECFPRRADGLRDT